MDLMDYRRKIIANSPHLSSAEGAVATFSDGADLPLKSLNVGIEPVQSGTGDPSPTNIRPISGWNAVKVTRSGESALKPSTAFTETQNGLTFTSDGKGTYSVKGTNTATTTVRSAILPVPSFTIPPSSSHTLYINNNAINSNVFLSFMIGSTSIDGWSFNALNRVSTSYGAMGNKLCDGLRIIVAAGQTVDITFSPMLLPKENTDDYNISFSSAGTVYGGTLNPMTGVLTVYPYYAAYNGETLTGRWVSDRDKYVAGTTPTIGAQVVDMSGTGTEVQLTPQQIRSLYGNNTIYADTGNVALEYWAHP